MRSAKATCFLKRTQAARRLRAYSTEFEPESGVFGTRLERLIQHVHGAAGVARGNLRREALGQLWIARMLGPEA